MAEKPINAMMKKNATYYNTLSREERAEARRKALRDEFVWWYEDEHGQRHLFSRVAGLVNGEIGQIRLGTKQMLVTIAASLNRRKHGYPKRWYYELSHTCGIPFCLKHTWWELPWVNTSRDGCHKYHHFKRCPHRPKKCLKQANLVKAKAAMLKRIADDREAKAAQKTKAQLAKAARNKSNYEANIEQRRAKARENQRIKRGTTKFSSKRKSKPGEH